MTGVQPRRAQTGQATVTQGQTATKRNPLCCICALIPGVLLCVIHTDFGDLGSVFFGGFHPGYFVVVAWIQPQTDNIIFSWSYSFPFIIIIIVIIAAAVRSTSCRLFQIMFSNWAQPIRLFQTLIHQQRCRKMPSVQMSPLCWDLLLFLRFWCSFVLIHPPPPPSSVYLCRWRAENHKARVIPTTLGCFFFFSFLVIILCCRPASYDVWECGRCGTESQPEPVFNDGLLQPEQRMLDPRERTGARSAPSLQHVHQEPALDRLQSL